MVRVTITTMDGEVLEMLLVGPNTSRPQPGELDGPVKLSAMVRDHIEHRFNVEEDD